MMTIFIYSDVVMNNTQLSCSDNLGLSSRQTQLSIHLKGSDIVARSTRFICLAKNRQTSTQVTTSLPPCSFFRFGNPMHESLPLSLSLSCSLYLRCLAQQISSERRRMIEARTAYLTREAYDSPTFLRPTPKSNVRRTTVRAIESGACIQLQPPPSRPPRLAR